MSVPPRVRVAPSASRTFGDLAGGLAADYGLKPDPWQQVVLDDWLAESGRKWVSLTCGLSVSRQNGKNGIVEMRELFGMVGRGEKFLHTAHQVKTAQKHFRRLKHFFGVCANDPAAKFPELNALVAELRNVNGQEAIYLRNGGSVEIVARSQGSGRGFTVDVIVCDEAQDMSDDDQEALLSTSSAAPLGNPQWIYTGTPPGPKANGEVFTRIRSEALGGKSRRMCWHEWSAGRDADFDSRDVWHAANPALGGRLQVAVVEGERANLTDSGFARERLGMWEEAANGAVIDAESWRMLTDESSVAVDRMVLGIDVNPERSRGAVALAGLRADGLGHVEVDEQRDGVGWIVGHVEALWKLNPISAVVVDAGSAAASLVGELRARQVKVLETGPREMASACGGFYDAVMDSRLRHIGQPQLGLAVAAARKRPLRDAWAWNRKNAASDITTLVAGTLALWGVGSAQVKSRRTPDGGRRESRRKAVVM